MSLGSRRTAQRPRSRDCCRNCTRYFGTATITAQNGRGGRDPIPGRTCLPPAAARATCRSAVPKGCPNNYRPLLQIARRRSTRRTLRAPAARPGGKDACTPGFLSPRRASAKARSSQTSAAANKITRSAAATAATSAGVAEASQRERRSCSRSVTLLAAATRFSSATTICAVAALPPARMSASCMCSLLPKPQA